MSDLDSRSVTLRQGIEQALRGDWCSALQLSAAVGLPEKQVAAHLEHLTKSLKSQPERVRIEPARCLGCGFEFTKRERLGAPGRCPKCRSERIQPPRFRIA